MLRLTLACVSLAHLVLLSSCSDSTDRNDDPAGEGNSPDTGSIASGPDGSRPASDASLDARAENKLDAARVPDIDSAVDAGAPDARGPDAAGSDAAPSFGDAATSDPEVDAAVANGTDAGGRDAAAVEVDATEPDASTSEVPDASEPDAGSPPAACDPSSPPNPGKLGLRTIVSSSSLSGLTEATQPPNSEDWYLVEQRGRILVFREGALLPEPFLDLSAEISLRPAIYEDRGLVSIAFAPDYATSGLLYVSVTPNEGPDANVDLLLEYRRSASDPYRVDLASRRNIIAVRGSRLGSDFITDNIHNGGRVTFGPDGMLYLALGDGGSVTCGSIEPDATQQIDSLFGKLLRLDLSKPAPYAADDNPFVQTGNPLVLHYGLRNPFRFSFDRKNGDLYLGDVGQNRYEEIDFAPLSARGLNFGWAPFEGNSRDTCPTRQLREGSVHTPPIFVADRRAGATSPFSDYTAIIGGVVYRGAAIPALDGAYVFGPYSGRRLGALYQCGSATSAVTSIAKSCDPNNPAEVCLQSLDGAPTFRELRAIVEDRAGELYVVANGNSLLKVVPAP
jgi:glucose/arabinose dehydrogenase